MEPEWLVNLMREENGVDAKLVIEKELTGRDVNRDLGRLLIPFNAIEDMDFLNEQEFNILDEHSNKIHDKGMDVILVDPKGVRWEVSLRRWDMESSANYAFVSGWNNVTFHNSREAGHMIRLWSFRSPQRLYFALETHQPQTILLTVPAPAEDLALSPPPPPPPYPSSDELREVSRLNFPRKKLRFAPVPQAHPHLLEAALKIALCSVTDLSDSILFTVPRKH